MLHPQNLETIGIKLAARIVERGELDAGVYILSLTLELLCHKLAEDMKSSEAKHLAHIARNCAGNVRKIAKEARDTQKLVDRAN
jgi:hypothetical protein